jgi:hypothetical protein
MFDPIKAAILHMRNGRTDEALRTIDLGWWLTDLESRAGRRNAGFRACHLQLKSPNQFTPF